MEWILVKSRAHIPDRIGRSRLAKHLTYVAGISQRGSTEPSPWASRIGIGLFITSISSIEL